jgi:uncharacterized protein (TIGR02145 family)
LWTTSDKAKSIYDPCPPGWRVPDGDSNGVWSKALGSSEIFTDESLYNTTNEGMNFSGKFGSASTIWYPASGYRDGNDNGGDGSLYDVGYRGYYWSASPRGSNRAYGLHFGSNGLVYPSYDSIIRVNGQSVRCLQVIDEVAGANAEESKQLLNSVVWKPQRKQGFLDNAFCGITGARSFDWVPVLVSLDGECCTFD